MPPFSFNSVAAISPPEETDQREPGCREPTKLPEPAARTGGAVIELGATAVSAAITGSLPRAAHGELFSHLLDEAGVRAALARARMSWRAGL